MVLTTLRIGLRPQPSKLGSIRAGRVGLLVLAFERVGKAYLGMARIVTPEGLAG
jgi:hypothetical protein